MCYLVVSSFVPDSFLKNGKQLNINNNNCGLNVAKSDLSQGRLESAAVCIVSTT